MTLTTARNPTRSRLSRLRFAMVTTFYPPYSFGGDGSYVRQLVHALARRGHQIDVIHDTDAFRLGAHQPEPQPLAEPDGIRVHRLRSRFGRLSCLATHQLGRPILHGRRIHRILDQDLDVIHFHNVSLVGGPGILSYGDAIKLYTAHEHWLVCPTHVLWRHNRERCDKRECLRCVLRHGRPPQIWRYQSLLERKSESIDAFLALCQSTADRHAAFGFQHQFRPTQPFLSDFEIPDSSWTGDPIPERPFFLYVGRLELIKGLQDVIPLFDDTCPADLLIAGAGEAEGELRALAQDRRRTVRFLGHRPQGELRSLYSKAVALVVPSKCDEVFPMVVLEAFREGTPIIARRLGPFPEIVTKSNGGLLFEDSRELKASLESLLSDVDLRNSLGRKAKKAFETYWSEDACIDDYLELIRGLAVRRGKTATASRIASLLETPLNDYEPV